MKLLSVKNISLYMAYAVTGALTLNSSHGETLSGTGISAVSQSNGAIQILDDTGIARAVISGYSIPSQFTCSGGAAQLISIDGKQTIAVTYTLSGSYSGTSQVQGYFNLSPYKVHARFVITSSSSISASSGMMQRQVLSPTVPQAVAKLGLWNAASNGGIPYETLDMKALTYGFSSTNLLVYSANANLTWNDGYSTHAPAVSAGSNVWVADIDIVIHNSRPTGAAAFIKERPIALDIWTAQPYNIWDTAGSYPLQVQTVNTSTLTKTLTVSWSARNFDGQIVSQGTTAQALNSGASWNQTISFPMASRDILFLCVTSSDGTNSVFKRTSMALLPSHTFLSGSESIFGVSAAFGLPSTANELNLLQRMGVRWLRRATYTTTQASSIGVIQNYTNTSANWTTTPASASWLDTQFTTAQTLGAPYWEIDNEMNLIGAICTSGYATEYVTNVLIPAKARKTALNASVGIMNGGLAGMDTAFASALYAAGGWDCLDAFAIHPGRGNFTADYPGEHNEVSTPNFWNFLGALRNANNLINTYGYKPLIVTESYACTHPNDSWHDSERQASENVVLQYALAMEQDVRVMYFYQLNDSIYTDVGGISATNSEYNYGLLNRDLSPKASLLGYCAIAEALDQATFARWMVFPNTNLHGLMYDTPRGPMAIVWSRSDGYLLNTGGTNFATPEPWIDAWLTKTTLSLPATGGTISIIDSIGRTQTASVTQGAATVTVDGAPRIIYGLSSTAGAGTVVIDNKDLTGIEITDSWPSSTSINGYYGTDYISDGNTSKGTKQVTYMPSIGVDGNYSVYLRWTAYSNRATNVPITITHSAGISTTTVNQQTNGSQWVLIGTYPMKAGTSNRVTISTMNTNGYVVADAAKFVLQ